MKQSKMKDLKLSVVIPVFNERETISQVIDRVRELNFELEILVVDDCSTDGSCEVIRSLAEQSRDLRLFFHEVNRGKGAALRTAFANVSGDIVVIQDADLEYNPQDIPQLIRPIMDGECEVVYGSRFLDKQDTSQWYRNWHRTGNVSLTAISNFFTGQHLTDMETCYKVFRRDTLADIAIKQDRFGVEPELTAKLSRRKFRICERPISYAQRSYEEGKKIGILDAVNALYCILRYALAD